MSSSDQKQLDLYAQLMDEVKARFACINHVTHGFTGLPTPVVREFCYLQIRFLCELTALACCRGDPGGGKLHGSCFLVIAAKLISLSLVKLSHRKTRSVECSKVGPKRPSSTRPA